MYHKSVFQIQVHGQQLLSADSGHYPSLCVTNTSHSNRDWGLLYPSVPLRITTYL